MHSGTPQPGRRFVGPTAALCLCALLMAVGLAAPGCYRKVISARGLGTEAVELEEPYQSDTWIDRQLFGDVEPSPRTRR
ncbi:MAG: hypothetical protein C0475_06445 [Planctomyces sp.]|nr:hypothetical protein [Planctomyces sp.]MBA4039923.1 hypothetical protein [Planctomyces sp.]